MLGLPSNSCLAHHVCVGEFWIAQLKNFEDTLSWLGNKASVCCSRGGSTLGSRSQSSSAGGGNGAMEGHVGGYGSSLRHNGSICGHDCGAY